MTACVEAGLGKRIRDVNGKLVKTVANRIPHDFRRTAVRNLERAGVSRSDAMAMVGHKTESIYRRYAISDEKSMRKRPPSWPCCTKPTRALTGKWCRSGKKRLLKGTRKVLEKQARENGVLSKAQRAETV